jgi:Homing endonuclease associated repeat/HNH endonuclease
MAHFNCKHCGNRFWSKHSVAQYCSRSCSAQAHRDILVKAAASALDYTDEELLQRLVEKARELGRTPSKREVRIYSTYTRRFGSYNKAVILAGLQPNTYMPSAYKRKDRHLVSLSLRFQILKRDGFRCQYCGGTPQEGYILHVDHILPRSKGGKTERDNLITACWLCNMGKSDE